MKKSILILVALSVATGFAVHYATRSDGPSNAAPVTASSSGQEPVAAATKQAAPPKAQPIAPRQESGAPHQDSPTALPGSPESIAFASELDTLISTKATYAEKQAAWKELLASGRIQDAIAELTQRAANDPQNAEIAATLGQAYLRACGTTQDVHSQAIWAMQADSSFDTALSLDPSNWEARFTKAMAMTYWPDNLNKGPEIIQQFSALIQQQEKEAPQPQFAPAYDLLGQQYAKAGQPDLAQQVWQRGAALYPDNQALQARLTPTQTARQ